MVFTSKTMLVFPPQPGASFRLCFVEDGPFLGRAYSKEDVDRLARENGISTTNDMTGGTSFPSGPNIDEEIAELRQQLRLSNERLGELDHESREYIQEAERNMDICQQMLHRTCQLAGIDLDL